ncbi:OprO/OprP family phosphate-selective porin [bacterium]|nr:OprO/OprP family phosphate-selective porin [Candidatus Neomarinimicrobiota bacterium]MDC0645991.1 OprO/OprP family phosphate-selective porin [bacterium]
MKNITRFLIFIYLLSTALFSQSNVNGVVFFNHSTELVENGTNAFNLKRAYLSYTNVVSEDVSYQVTYDMGGNSSGSSHTAFLKVAMVRWKTNLGNITMGMQGMNMFKTTENTWGHRFIQAMAMDTYGFSASADIGIGLSRSFGSFSTSALVTNGGGYKKIESDSHKKLSLHAVFGEPKLNKNDGYNIGASYSIEPRDIDLISTETVNVLSLFAAYAGKGFRGGFEFDNKWVFQEKEYDENSNIICVYGTYKINDKLSALARFDHIDMFTSIRDNGIGAIISGVHYKAEKGLSIAPTIRLKAHENGEVENLFVVNFQFKF